MLRFPPMKILRKRARRMLARTPSPYEQIQLLQRQHPPQYDPSNSLLPALRRCLPPDVDALFEYGIAWEGEIGVMTANAEIHTLAPSEEYVIEFYTGAKKLLYTVARGMGAATRVHFPPPAPAVEPALSIQQVAVLMGKVFLTYAATQQLLAPQHPAHEEQKKLAHQLATAAEFFLLAHEIAHAWFAHESISSGETRLRGHQITWEEEFACDQFAITWLLQDALSRSGAPPVRMVYAGAEFALRVLTCLENVGTPFQDTHPPAKERLQVLRIMTQQLCDKLKVEFDRIRTIAIAHDEFLEEIVRRIQGVDPTPNQDRSRVRSKLIVLLEECAKGMVDEEFAVAELILFRKYSSGEVMAGAMHDAFEHFQARQPDIAELLERLKVKLPESVLSLSKGSDSLQ